MDRRAICCTIRSQAGFLIGLYWGYSQFKGYCVVFGAFPCDLPACLDGMYMGDTMADARRAASEFNLACTIPIGSAVSHV